MLISESQAWQIVDIFAQSMVAATDDIVAIFVIGSLATGAYRLGRSDIDTIIVIRDASAEATPATLRRIRDRFQREYAIPKGLGAVVIRYRQLFPPYDPDEELIPEILRLKQQGVIVWGALDITAIPEFDAADLEAYMVVFYRWLHANFVDQRPDSSRTIDATVNTILYELRALIWGATGEYVLDKREVVLRATPAVADSRSREMLKDMYNYLDGADEPAMPLSYWEDALQLVAREVYGQLPALLPIT